MNCSEGVENAGGQLLNQAESTNRIDNYQEPAQHKGGAGNDEEYVKNSHIRHAAPTPLLACSSARVRQMERTDNLVPPRLWLRQQLLAVFALLRS